MKKTAVNVFLGFVIGVSMLVPGVSGGSIAVLLGIYDDLLCAVSELTKDFRKNFMLLISVALGGVLGFFVMAKSFRMLLESAYIQMLYLFLGIIICGVILQWKYTVKEFGRVGIPMVLFGVLAVLLLRLLPQELLSFPGASVFLRFVLFVFTGLLLGGALILPGVSFSLMLVILGIYDEFVAAVEQLDFRFLFPLALCTLFGVIVLSKVLHGFLKRSPLQCHSLILGFVLASLVEVYPGLPPKENGVMCALLLILGIVAPMLLDCLFKRKRVVETSDKC